MRPEQTPPTVLFDILNLSSKYLANQLLFPSSFFGMFIHYPAKFGKLLLTIGGEIICQT